MLPSKSLGLALAVYVYAAAAHQSLPNPHVDCEFSVYRSRYDLCPLFLDRGQDPRLVTVHAELMKNTHLFYEISFGGLLKAQSGEEAEPQVSTGEVIALSNPQMG